jgi:hypothetical protein
VVAGGAGSPLPIDQWHATHNHPHWSSTPTGTILQIRQWGFYEGHVMISKEKGLYAHRYGLGTSMNPFRIDPTILIPILKQCHIPAAANHPWEDSL